MVVRTLPREYALRYRDWVEANRARVHEATGGRVGYVHMPDMGPRGYRRVPPLLLARWTATGWSIDVRYNGGGHVSQLLLEKLLRKRIGYDANRWGARVLPDRRADGPDGRADQRVRRLRRRHLQPRFKLYGLGPLVGKRTWGGVVGIWPRHSLVDGTITTQPEFAFWFQDVGWGLENYGTDPDIEVEIRPQDYARGEDPQIARALAEVQGILRREKPRIPDFEPRPVLKPPRLPRRG